MRFFVLEKDRLNILSIQEAVEKIFNYSQTYSNADDFYQNQRDFHICQFSLSYEKDQYHFCKGFLQWGLSAKVPWKSLCSTGWFPIIF